MYQSIVAMGLNLERDNHRSYINQRCTEAQIGTLVQAAGNPNRSGLLPVLSRYPCSSCGQRNGKLATSYNAWVDEEGGRTCYRQRLCVACVTNLVGSLLASASDSSPNVCVCPSCGKDASSDLSPLYLTIYPPKQEPKEFALTTCTSCAKQWRESLSANADLMRDRQGDVGAGAASAWADVFDSSPAPTITLPDSESENSLP